MHRPPANAPSTHQADAIAGFKQAVFGLVQRILDVDGIRFFIYVPWAQLKGDSASDTQLDQMVQQYTDAFWAVDPMHPSRFDETDRVVVSNTMLMTDEAWRNSAIFMGFYEPNGYHHNCDVFLRQQGRIVAVLSLVRRRAATPFTEAEVDRLAQIQPFVEYSLSAVHVPKRVLTRTSLAAEFRLTAREIDVVEIAMTGLSNKVLCRHLGVSLPTLRSHLQSIYAKVGVSSNAELIARLAGVGVST